MTQIFIMSILLLVVIATFISVPVLVKPLIKFHQNWNRCKSCYDVNFFLWVIFCSHLKIFFHHLNQFLFPTEPHPIEIFLYSTNHRLTHRTILPPHSPRTSPLHLHPSHSHLITSNIPNRLVIWQVLLLFPKPV